MRFVCNPMRRLAHAWRARVRTCRTLASVPTVCILLLWVSKPPFSCVNVNSRDRARPYSSAPSRGLNGWLVRSLGRIMRRVRRILANVLADHANARRAFFRALGSIKQALVPRRWRKTTGGGPAPFCQVILNYTYKGKCQDAFFCPTHVRGFMNALAHLVYLIGPILVSFACISGALARA